MMNVIRGKRAIDPIERYGSSKALTISVMSYGRLNSILRNLMFNRKK